MKREAENFIELGKMTKNTNIMDIKKGEELRKIWGNKPCNHPSFSKETQSQVLPEGYVEQKTGDYLCTVCGAEFTEWEKSEIEARRAQ